MLSFSERLSSGKVLVADGATGTNLQKLGLPSGRHPEEWVLEAPEKILGLERAFIEAGSDIILTCTFGATRPRLQSTSYAADVIRINQAAVQLAQEAASIRPGTFIAGSMGPLGQLLKPYGPMTPDEARSAYSEQAQALSQAGVDLIVIETQYALDEVDIALAAVRAMTDMPVVVSFSYDRGTRTMMGVRPAQVASRYAAQGPALIGANCGTTLENMETILGEYGSALPGFPLWAKPNAGLPRIEEGETVYDVGPQQMADFARRAMALGARIIGGCCGSTPEHVAAIADAAKA